MVQVRPDDSDVYNADGMRVSATPSGETTTNFLLNGREIAEEITGSSDVSDVGRALIGQISGTARSVYHSDGPGSTRAISNGSQAVTEAGIYDAYGNVLYPTSGAPNFGFAGRSRYYADATGLDYLKARYYDPADGRFISRDPAGYRGGPNLYAYVWNNPANSVDPSGRLESHIGGPYDYIIGIIGMFVTDPEGVALACAACATGLAVNAAGPFVDCI